jgi:hypothetical protein
MKKLLFVSIILFLPLFTLSQSWERGSKNDSRTDCKYGQCIAIAKSTGLPCKNCVSKEYDSHCYNHSLIKNNDINIKVPEIKLPSIDPFLKE